MSEDIEDAVGHLRYLLGQKKHEEALQYFKRSGIPEDYLDFGYIPLLYLAANEGSMPLVKYLIEQGADLIEIFGRREVATTPFAGALFAGSIEVMALLYHYERQLEYNPHEDRTAHFLELTYRKPERAKLFHEECERLAKENPRLPERTIKRLRNKYLRPDCKLDRVSPISMFGSGAGSGVSVSAGFPKTVAAPAVVDKPMEDKCDVEPLLDGANVGGASGLRRRRAS